MLARTAIVHSGWRSQNRTSGPARYTVTAADDTEYAEAIPSERDQKEWDLRSD